MISRPSSVEDVRRRVRGWRAAEERERAERRRKGPMDPGRAFAAAAELRALRPELFSGTDPIREREVAEVRRVWAMLRERLPWAHDANRER